jgi:hypothetical protein
MNISRNLIKALMVAMFSMFVGYSINCNTTPSKRESVVLNGYNTQIFDLDINPITADNFIAALVGKRVMLDEMAGPQATLYVVIISGGGQYSDVIHMRKALSQAPNVTVICKYCASAAGYLFATYNGPRLAIDKSKLMMHEMYMNHITLKKYLDQDLLNSLKNSSDEFDAAMYTIIGISKQEYESKITNAEWVVNGQELVDLHLATSIVDIQCDQYINYLLPNTCSK